MYWSHTQGLLWNVSNGEIFIRQDNFELIAHGTIFKEAGTMLK